MQINELLDRYKLISDQVSKQEIRLVLEQLERVIQQGVEGAVVEFGCYNGTTSLFIQRWLQATEPRPFHVYDSFAGLPPKTLADQSPAGEQFKTGELSASKAEFIRHFKQASLPIPIIHKGWFNDLTPDAVPAPVALAFLDGDYYESILTSLQLIQDKLSPGAVIVVDDYQSEALPGAAKAVHDWLKLRPGWHLQVRASLAILKRDDTDGYSESRSYDRFVPSK